MFLNQNKIKINNKNLFLQFFLLFNQDLLERSTQISTLFHLIKEHMSNPYTYYLQFHDDK